MNRPHNPKIEVAKELPPPSARGVVALCVCADGAAASNARGGVLGAVERALAEGDFEGKEETTLLVHAATEEGPRRLLLVGLGPSAEVRPDVLSRAAAAAARRAREAAASHLTLVVPGHGDQSLAARAAAEGAVLGCYDNGFYQSEEEGRVALERLTLVAEGTDLRAAVERGRVVA